MGTAPAFQLTSPLFPMIIKAMAITRCPYCHAIIDENDKCCHNCGTQLLFSDDEAIEEEIPGEKIIDADVEEKDYTVDEPEDEKRPAAKKDLESEIDEELEEELGEPAEATAIERRMAAETAEEDDGDVTEEVILVDESEPVEPESKVESAVLEKAGPVDASGPEPAAATVAEKDVEAKDAKEGEAAEEGESEDEFDLEEEELADELEVDLEEDLDEAIAPEPEVPANAETGDETREYAVLASPTAETAEKAPEPLPSSPEESAIEYAAESEAPDMAATAGEAGLRPATFDSQELENLGKTVDLSREKIDKFLEVMSAKKVETGPVPPEPEPEEAPEPPTGTLPPWASTMKGAPVFPEPTGPVETRKIRGGEPATPDTEEVEIFPRRRDSDSTMGLPEKVSQAPLPFETPADEGEEGEEE